MTSRRGTLIEDGARELLQVHGYSVEVIPPGFRKRFPPAHLVASLPKGETRYIRIRKLSHLPSTPATILQKCSRDLEQFRKHRARHGDRTSVHYEIWIYSLTYGFRCFEMLRDSIREIPKPAQYRTGSSRAGGVA